MAGNGWGGGNQIILANDQTPVDLCRQAWRMISPRPACGWGGVEPLNGFKESRLPLAGGHRLLTGLSAVVAQELGEWIKPRSPSEGPRLMVMWEERRQDPPWELKNAIGEYASRSTMAIPNQRSWILTYDSRCRQPSNICLPRAINAPTTPS